MFLSTTTVLGTDELAGSYYLEPRRRVEPHKVRAVRCSYLVCKKKYKKQKKKKTQKKTKFDGPESRVGSTLARRFTASSKWSALSLWWQPDGTMALNPSTLVKV